MGLMLSILITCVGVAELLAFYTNVRRRLVMPVHPKLPQPHPRLQQHDREMGDVTQNYLKELNRERNRLLNEIRRLEGDQRRRSASPDSTHFKSVPFAQNISLNVASGSHPIQTPQNATDISTSPSYGNEESYDEYQEHGRVDSFNESKPIGHKFPSYTDSGPPQKSNLNKPAYEDAPQIVLSDSAYESSLDSYEHREREASPFPTYERIAPRGSICSELIGNPTVSVDEIDEEGYRSHSPSFSQKIEKRQDEFLKSQFDSKDYWKHKSKSRSRTPEILRDNLLDFEKKSRSRSPSPLVLQKHGESDQQQQSSTSSDDQQKSSASGDHQQQRSTSSGDHHQRSASSGDHQHQRSASDIYKSSTRTESIDVEPATITELPNDKIGVEQEVLEIVDGKLTTHEQHKRMFKNKKQRKNKKHESQLQEEQQRIERQADYATYGSSSTVIGVDKNAIDSTRLQKVEMEEVQDAGPSSSKQGEPFWVKKT